jgi:hypothetical protein
MAAGGGFEPPRVLPRPSLSRRAPYHSVTQPWRVGQDSNLRGCYTLRRSRTLPSATRPPTRWRRVGDSNPRAQGYWTRRISKPVPYQTRPTLQDV